MKFFLILFYIMFLYGCSTKNVPTYSSPTIIPAPNTEAAVAPTPVTNDCNTQAVKTSTQTQASLEQMRTNSQEGNKDLRDIKENLHNQTNCAKRIREQYEPVATTPVTPNN